MSDRITGIAWLAMVYPESAPADWLTYLRQIGLKFAVSPLHDKDIWLSDGDGHKKGDFKKAHYHVLVVYKNTTTLSNIKSFFKYCNTQRIIKCADPQGSINYWPHDEDDLSLGKALYDPDEIKFYNEFSLAEAAVIKDEEEDEIVFAIKKIIKEHEFTEYSQLDDYLELEQSWPELHRYCRRHTLYLNAYIKSRRYGQGDILDYMNLKSSYDKLKLELEDALKNSCQG